MVHECGLIKRNGAESPHSCLACQHEIQRTGGSQGHAVWQELTLRSTGQDYVLGGMLFHHGQAEEVAARIQRVAEVRCHMPPTTSRRGSMVESGGVPVAYS